MGIPTVLDETRPMGGLSQLQRYRGERSSQLELNANARHKPQKKCHSHGPELRKL